MRLILIAPENVYEHEVDPFMEVQDLQALVEAEVSDRFLSARLSHLLGQRLNDSEALLI